MKADVFTNTIIVEDTIRVLPRLIKADKQYDVIIADPPYNIGKDFGNDTEIMPIDDYVEWADAWIKDCFQLVNKQRLTLLVWVPRNYCANICSLPYPRATLVGVALYQQNGTIIKILAKVPRNNIVSVETEYAAHKFGDRPNQRTLYRELSKECCRKSPKRHAFTLWLIRQK